MNTPFKSIAIIAFGLIIMHSGCGRSDRSRSERQESAEEISRDTIQKEVREIVYPLPSPFTLYEKLNSIGASYMDEILNPTDNADQYFTEKQKALMLGVYSADLSYVTTYDRTEEIQNYSRVVKSLTEDLNVDIDFTEYSGQKARESLQNKDSLVNYITDVFFNTYSSLNNMGSPALSGLMVAGIWSEGLYIATHISEDTYANYEIVRLILDQKKSLGNVIDLLEKFKEDRTSGALYKEFTQLMAIYKEAGSDLTEEELHRITRAIEDIREIIVS